MNKKQIIIGLVVLVVVGVVAGIGWTWNWKFWEKKGEIEKPQTEIQLKAENKSDNKSDKVATSTESYIDISNWKTYKDEKYDYEIKYPPNWKLKEGYSVVSEGKEEKFISIFYIPVGYSSSHEATKSKVENMGIGICYFKNESAPYYFTKRQIEIEKKKSPEKFVSLGSLNFLRTVKYGHIYFESYLKTDKGYYTIRGRIFDPLNKGYENLIKQILSTFKIRSAN